MERACLPEPPCDCLMVTSWPVLPFQYLAKAWLNSTYNSRVGSYDTLSSVTGALAACCCANAPVATPAPARVKPAIAAAARGILIKSRRVLTALLRVVDGADCWVAHPERERQS